MLQVYKSKLEYYTKALENMEDRVFNIERAETIEEVLKHTKWWNSVEEVELYMQENEVSFEEFIQSCIENEFYHTCNKYGNSYETLTKWEVKDRIQDLKWDIKHSNNVW